LGYSGELIHNGIIKVCKEGQWAMSTLRIILDKSVVYGLKNPQIDSLDRHFFLVVPPILINEILADLAKKAEEPSIENKISQHSYRISGNRGIAEHYRTLLANSLMGNQFDMDGRFFPAGQTTVQTDSGSFGTKIETQLEDETIFRWERGQFTKEEIAWATKWRKKAEIPVFTTFYTDHIKKAGLEFKPPKSDKDLVETVDSLLEERRLQGRLLPMLARAFGIPERSQATNINRWFKEGKPMLKDFAPYAWFCLRANMIWALGMTNPGLFQSDKNDRKDLEYCYYLPFCEIFASHDRKHKRLVPFLLKSAQTFVNGQVLKDDLTQLDEKWEALSQDEKKRIYFERGGAPPEDENSIVFQLWKKYRGKIARQLFPEILKTMVVDSSLPEEEQVPITFEEMIRTITKKLEPSRELPYNERKNIKETDFAVRSTRISKERLLKMYPQLTEADLEKKDSD
jgi:hypothetical protein